MVNDSQQFDALRKLLAVKQHEIPPPGYFDRLPRDIHARLAAQNQPAARTPEPQRPRSTNWLANLIRLAEARPSLAGAFSAGVCGLILTGIIYANQQEKPATSILPEIVQTPPLLPATDQTMSWANGTPMLASTNPLLARPPAAGLFDGTYLKSQPAAFPQPAR